MQGQGAVNGVEKAQAPAKTPWGFEWKTRARFMWAPLICVSFGRDERGNIRVAKGHLAIGQFAIGGIAIGQVSLGVISVGQFALGVISLAQVAMAVVVAFGQFAVGTFAVGYIVAGMYAKGYMGWGKFLWTPERTDMEAVATFETVRWWFQQELYTMWFSLKFAIKMGIKKITTLFNN
jgi:hypothetical protein